MAQKRMFDKAIIDTDKFMDLPITAKALYFLLGMEADDEGFVSYKKVLRIHGGTDDDIKILMAKNFVIGFPSGVVVITDWNKNNWLDRRRIVATEYQAEREQLIITETRKYQLLPNAKPLLSHRLATAKHPLRENRIEEYSIIENIPQLEEKKLSTGKGQPPYLISKDFFNNKSSPYRTEARKLLITSGLDEQTADSELEKFISYWTELTKSGNKQRWELEKTFEVKRRLATWLDHFLKYNNNKGNNSNDNNYRRLLHDGSYAINRFGVWVSEKDPNIKIDLHYYPELK